MTNLTLIYITAAVFIFQGVVIAITHLIIKRALWEFLDEYPTWGVEIRLWGYDWTKRLMRFQAGTLAAILLTAIIISILLFG
jgi:hypothetical protein